MQHLEALRRDPESPAAAESVRTEARAQGAFREYACAFAERGAYLADRARVKDAIASLVEAALVFEEELEDLESAANAYQRVLEIETGHRRALFALGLLFHDLGRWDDLVALYRRRLEQTKDDGERTTLHLYIAELLSERFDDDHAAFKEVLAASRLAPRNIRIIGRLEKLGERINKIDEVAVVIGDLILHQEDPRVRAALSLRLAELHLGPLADSQRALVYLRSALADDGGNPEILSEIEDVFRERARFDDLAELLEEAAKDRRVGPHRVRLERELARIYELELNDQKRALHALTRAAKIAFEDRELLDEVLRIGLISANMEPVAQTFEDVTARTENGLLRTYLRLKLGHIYAGQLARPEDAIRVYTAILDDDPGHQEAQRRMAKLGVIRQADAVSVSTEGKKPESLAKRVGTSAIETRADEVPTEIAALGRGFGPESETALDPELHPVMAQPLIDDLLDVPRLRQPPPPPPRDSSPDEYTEMEVQKSFVHESTMVMRARKSPPPPPPTLDVEEEEGELAAEAETEDVEDVDLDVDLDSPEHAVSLLLQLEEASDPLVDPAESVPEARVVPLNTEELEIPPLAAGAFGSEGADSSLPESYSEPPPPAPPAKLTDDLDERISALQQELNEASKANDQARQVELLEELVRTHERLNQDERAFFSIVRLAKTAPTLDRLEDAIRLGRRAQGYPLLIETVETLGPQLPVEAQVRLSMGLAEVELEDLRDVSAAVARIAKAHALAPADNAVFERWIVVLEVSRRFAELADVLRTRALEIAGTNEAISMVRRAAHIREVNLEDPRGAAEVLVTYLARVPERDDLREEAAGLLEKAGAWRELAGLLESTVLRIEGSERADVRLRIAKLYRDKLREPQLAEQTLRVGLEERARDPALLSMLEESYEARGAWEELVDVLIRQLDVLKGARLRNTVRRKIAEIAELHLDDEGLALEILADAVRDDAGDLDALGDLERLRRARGDWDGVRDVLVLRSQAVPDPKDRSAALVAIAAIDVEINFDLDAAAEGLRDALAIDPKNEEGLNALAALEDQRGDYVAAMDVLRRLAEESTGAARARALVRLGRIYEDRFDDVESAGAEYAQAYEADSQFLDAILSLFRIREREEDYVAALELASRAAALHDDERDRAALWRRAGTIAQDRVGDELRALECYERALASDPDDLATMATVGELFLKRGDAERAYPHLKHAAEGLSDPERKASLYHSAASAAEKTKKHAEAIECYEAALERAPRALEPLKRLAVLYEGTGDHGRAYELSALLLLHHEGAFGPAEKAQVYLRMARAKGIAKEYEAAGRLAKKAHLLAESSAEPLVLLAEVLPETGEAFEAAECLRKLSQIYKTAKDKRDALYRAAVLLAERANDVARASAMLAEAQTFIPEDIEVADLLAIYRERMQDARGASTALTVPARLLSGRPRADLLVRAAKISGGPGRDRPTAKKLLAEAVAIVPTHQEALAELRVMQELDGELEAFVALSEKAAQQFLEDPSTSRDAQDLDRKAAALALYTDVLRTYRLKLRDPERALGALRKVLELSADEAAKREDLARLLDEVADKNKNGQSAALVKEAIAVWARLVEEQPGFVEGVAKLRALYERSGEPAMAHLQEELLEALAGGAAPIARNPAEKEPTKPPLPKQRLDVPHHPLEKTSLEKLFLELGYAPIKALYEWMPEPKPKKKDLVGMAGLGAHVSRPIEHAAAVLGLDVPPVFVRDDAPLAIVPALVLDQPALIVSLALAEKRTSGELRFLAGRALSLLRPRALALATIPLEILRDGLAGFAKPVIAPETVHADPRTSKKRGKALEKALKEPERNRLAEEVGRWLLAPKRATLAEEKNAVMRSAERAGLVASGSLLVSLGMLSVLSEGHVERSWRLPMIEWAQTRMFAEILRRLS